MAMGQEKPQDPQVLLICFLCKYGFLGRFLHSQITTSTTNVGCFLEVLSSEPVPKSTLSVVVLLVGILLKQTTPIRFGVNVVGFCTKQLFQVWGVFVVTLKRFWMAKPSAYVILVWMCFGSSLCYQNHQQSL